MPTVLAVRPEGFVDAATVLGCGVADAVASAWSELLYDLVDVAGMAGDDEVGASWGGHYDDAAGVVRNAGCDLIDALHRLAALLQQTAINYAAADEWSTPGWSPQAVVTRWRHETARLGAVPTAIGAATPQPHGWSLLQHAIDRLWPNGHQDQLRAAAGAWRSAAERLDQLAPDIGSAARLMLLQQSPEAADAFTAIDSMIARVHAVADGCRGIARSCAEYADRLDAAHHAILGELKSFLEWTAGIEGAAAVCAVFTFGASEAAGQAGEAVEIARAAKAIKKVLDILDTAMVGVRADIAWAATKLRTLRTELAIVLRRTPTVAEFDRAEAANPAGVNLQLANRDIPVVRPAIVKLDPADRAIANLQRAEAESSELIECEWGNRATLDDHFDRHAGDFGSDSPADYVRASQDFLARARREHLPMKIDRSGNIRVYDPATNTFGSYTAGGKTRTFFKPAEPSYWARQKGTLR